MTRLHRRDLLVQPDLTDRRDLKAPKLDVAAAPTFREVMFDAAVALHRVAPVRAMMAAAGAAIGLMILPWTHCLAWLSGAMVLEVWGWFATRRQFRNLPLARRGELNFLAHYLVLNSCWLLLALLFWQSGSVQGQAAGLVVLLSVITVLVLLFQTAPIVFLIGGAAPAMGALVIVALSDGRDWRQILPIAGVVGLSLLFSLGRALEAPSSQEAQRRLNDSLNQFRVLADNVSDIIARTDMNGVNRYISPASLAVLGFTPDELIGRHRRDQLHPDDGQIVTDGFERLLADPGHVETFTVRLRHKDGRWIWVQSSARVVYEDGVPVGVIDVSRDVTERVAADEALREARLEAESANRAKAEFLANVSHEIRTPMNGVLGALHLLEREDISGEGRELMRQANGCGRMLSQLLNDVLDFSRIDAGQLDLAPEPMQVGKALDAVLAMLCGQARAKGLELRSVATGEDLWIEADPVRVQQAMFNLIGNAVKFTASGHVAVRLLVEPATDGRRHVRLEVEDTGIGMTPEVQAHLFECFRQAESDTARRFGGTGLGLSISQALARMMGGQIGFSSATAKGSTFWLDFHAPAARDVAVETAEEGLFDGVRILLVEDNPTNRLVASTMLTRLGAAVDEAEDGLIGLKAARTVGYDLILMDVQMPHMDGVEATRAIRGLSGPASETPIIGLTANVMAHQRQEYAAAGMNGVVAKPLSPAALLSEIARLMDAQPEALAASA